MEDHKAFYALIAKSLGDDVAIVKRRARLLIYALAYSTIWIAGTTVFAWIADWDLVGKILITFCGAMQSCTNIMCINLIITWRDIEIKNKLSARNVSLNMRDQ